MGGDFGGHQRAVRRKPARQPNSNFYYWLTLACGMLLLTSAVAAVLLRPLAWAPVATSAVEERRRDLALLPAAEKSEPAAIVPQTDVRRAEPNTAGRLPEEKLTAEIVGPPEALTAGARAEAEAVLGQPVTPRSGPNTVGPPPEHPKSKPDTVDPPAEALTGKSQTETLVAKPELPKPGPNTVASPSDAQTSGPETEAAVRRPEAQELHSKANGLAVPQLVLPADLAKKVGQKIWQNETGGNRDGITAWNAGEDFASLGIGHFIWFPAGKKASFEESFALLIEFMHRTNVRLPSWIDETPLPPCPWPNRADFMKSFNSPQMKELRQFLLDTVAEQTQFLVTRAQTAMEKIIDDTSDSAERAHVITQFSRIVQASRDLYPLIDYVNFKGEGVNPAETAVDRQTGKRQGWGLKQVLLKMTGTSTDRKVVLAEFADAAQFVLRQRVRNLPANRAFEPGWLSRVETYRRPLVEVEATSNKAGERK